MLRSRLLVWLLALSVLVLAVVGGVAWARQRADNLAGICAETGQRLTDQEVLDRAATDTMYVRESVLDHRLRAGELLPSQDVSRYDDPARFSADHPDCCRIVAPEELRAEEQPPVWARPRGAYHAHVRVGFTAGPGYARERLLIVDNCGKVSTSFWD